MIKPGILRCWDTRLDERFFSLDELDQKLQRHLDFDDGFFIEAGANDGVRQSNTLHFERYRGWHGLLVEPIPALAWQCRLLRPRSVTVNAALGSQEQSGDRLSMTYCHLMSTVDGAMSNPEEQQAHIQVGAAIQKVSPYRLTVPSVSLTDLLTRYQIRRIDLLSLDVEGFEEDALRGLDFNRYRPRYMLIEARYRSKVEALVEPYYEIVTELTERDILYKSRAYSTLTVSWGWRYSLDRHFGYLAALSRWYRD